MRQQQKDMQIISNINDEVLVLEQKIKRLEHSIVETHLARLAATIWHFKTRGTAVKSNTHDEHGSEKLCSLKEAIRKYKRSIYDSGCIGEELLRKMFSLDGVMGDEIRTARRQTVQRIQSAIDSVDAIVNKAKSWHALVDVASHLETTGPKTDEVVADKSPEVQEDNEKAAGIVKEDADNEDTDTAERVEKDADETYTEKLLEENQEEPEPEQEQEEQERQLPRWRPQFHQQRTENGLTLIADFGGVDHSSLEVVKDEDTRSIIVRGVKPPQRLHNPLFTRFSQPYGWFEEKFVLPKEFSMNVTSKLSGRHLLLNVSRKAAPRRPRFTQRSPFDTRHLHQRSPFDAIFGF